MPSPQPYLPRFLQSRPLAPDFAQFRLEVPVFHLRPSDSRFFPPLLRLFYFVAQRREAFRAFNFPLSAILGPFGNPSRNRSSKFLLFSFLVDFGRAPQFSLPSPK